MTRPPAPSPLLPACPVCGGSAWSGHRAGTLLRGCAGCGVVLNDRSAGRTEEEGLYRHYTRQTGADRAADAGRVVAAAQWAWLRELWSSAGAAGTAGMAGTAEPPAVLDVGCGHGAFLLAVREQGGRAHGIELDPEGVEACRSRGIEVSAGSVFDVRLPAGPWDLITLWDVVEHLEEPHAALAALAPLLAPGGLLVLRGRNARLHVTSKTLYARIRPLASRLGVPDLSCVHRWGLAPHHYVRLLRSAGLERVRIHPGLPTPGDRSRTLGRAGSLLKGAARASGSLLYRLSGHRLYAFPSVLVSAGGTS